MNTATHHPGCWNRKPFVPAYKATNGRQWIPAFGAQSCRYSVSNLGQQDKGCVGCKWRKESTQGAQ